jgi:hypothetical protein
VKLILRREPPRPDCTLGLLFVGTLSLCTIERPWIPSAVGKGGQKGVSCVPVGTYRLVRHNSDAHPMTWALVNPELDVVHFATDADPRRALVLIHIANWARELRGCIGVGTRAQSDSAGTHMVADSKKAMRLLQATVPWTDEHTLEIS